MEKEILSISQNQIKVEYKFLNTTNKDISSIIAFPTPRIKCGYWHNFQYPDDFTVIVNGEKIKIKKETRAYLKETEITESLERLKLPKDCLKVFKHNDITLYKTLQNLGLAESWDDPQDILYESEVKYHWEQTFPANQTVSVVHTYTPIKGTGVHAWSENEENVSIMGIELMKSYHQEIAAYDKVYWANKNPNKKWNLPGGDAGFEVVRYILKTGNNWKRPIKDFTLNIFFENSNPAHFFGTVNLEGIKKITPKHYQLKKKNFIPKSDLILMFTGDDTTKNSTKINSYMNVIKSAKNRKRYKWACFFHKTSMIF